MDTLHLRRPHTSFEGCRDANMVSVPDAVQKWLSDGRLNVERFYVEQQNDDGSDRVVPSGQIAINVGGIFVFFLPLQGPPPFVISMPPTDSKALTKFIKLANAQYHATQGDALTAATTAYLNISDELDAENMSGASGESDESCLTYEAESIESAMDAAETVRNDHRPVRMYASHSHFYDTSGLQASAVPRVLSDVEFFISSVHTGWTAAPSKQQLAVWKVQLFGLDPASQLSRDVVRVSPQDPSHPEGTIDLLVTFPPTYPFKPPFVRVVRPCLMFTPSRAVRPCLTLCPPVFSCGGVMSIPLLTEEGWNTTYDLNKVIDAVRDKILVPSPASTVVVNCNKPRYNSMDTAIAYHLLMTTFEYLNSTWTNSGGLIGNPKSSARSKQRLVCSAWRDAYWGCTKRLIIRDVSQFSELIPKLVSLTELRFDCSIPCTPKKSPFKLTYPVRLDLRKAQFIAAGALEEILPVESIEVVDASEPSTAGDDTLLKFTSLRELNAAQNPRISNAHPFANTLVKLNASGARCGIGDKGLLDTKFLKDLNASGNRRITTTAPFGQSLVKLDASNDCVLDQRLEECGIDDKGLVFAEHLVELNAANNGLIRTTAPFCRSLLILNASNKHSGSIPLSPHQICGIGDAGLVDARNLTVLNASGNLKITTTAPFGHSLVQLDASNECGIGDAGLVFAEQLVELNAANNGWIHTTVPFCRSLLILNASNFPLPLRPFARCGLGDYGLMAAHNLTDLNASHNPFITSTDPFAQSLRRLQANGSCGICDTGLVFATELLDVEARDNPRISAERTLERAPQILSFRNQ